MPAHLSTADSLALSSTLAAGLKDQTSTSFQLYTTQMGHQRPARGRFKVMQHTSSQGSRHLSQVLTPPEPLLALDQTGGGTRSPTSPILLTQPLEHQGPSTGAEEPSVPSLITCEWLLEQLGIWDSPA